MKNSLSEGNSRAILSEEPISLSRIDGIGKQSASKLSSSSHSSYISTSSRNNSIPEKIRILTFEGENLNNSCKSNSEPHSSLLEISKCLDGEEINEDEPFNRSSNSDDSLKKFSCSSLVTNKILINENIIYISNISLHCLFHQFS